MTDSVVSGAHPQSQPPHTVLADPQFPPSLKNCVSGTKDGGTSFPLPASRPGAQYPYPPILPPLENMWRMPADNWHEEESGTLAGITAQKPCQCTRLEAGVILQYMLDSITAVFREGYERPL